MKAALAAIFCLLNLGTAGAQALNAHALAVDLSSAMRLDEFFANRANHVAREVHRMNRSSPERAVCAATAFRAEEFREHAPKVLEKLLSPEELVEGLKFYRSKVGQRWVDKTFDVFQAKDTGAAPKVKLSRKEVAEVDAFWNSATGARIANMANITSSPDAQLPSLPAGGYSLAAMRRCPAPPP